MIKLVLFLTMRCLVWFVDQALFTDRQYPVKHYIKEAKKLKHKADVEVSYLCLL